MRDLILTLNPRLTYTQVAVYRMSTPVFLKKINHPSNELDEFENFAQQTFYRVNVILKELRDNDIDVDLLRVIIGQGGLVKPVESGVYAVNDSMLKDLKDDNLGEDVVNLGGFIAHGIAGLLPNAEAYIADPVVVDEFEDIARITGLPELKRRSIFHVLNQKTVARKYAKGIYKKYEDLNLIVVHLGNGISIGAHSKGRVIDANQAYDGDGPFSPIRSGSLPMGDVIKMCFSGEYSESEMLRKQSRKGGLFAYFGTNRGLDVCKMAQGGDAKAQEILDAMAYQVSKTIGSMYPVFDDDEVDAIIITGGMAKNNSLVKAVRHRVDKIAPVVMSPGADTLGALWSYGRMILRSEIKVKEY